MSIVHCQAVKYSKELTRDESRDGFRYWSTLLPTKFWTNSETFRSNHNHQQRQYYPSATSSEMETMLDKEAIEEEARDSVSQPSHSPQIASSTPSYAKSAVNSMSSQNSTPKMVVSTNCSNLIKQKSFPAGFLSNYSVDNATEAYLCSTKNGVTNAIQKPIVKIA
ncbi:hypothetical protein V8G54_023854 [Vigna mungo]|uniref:Uncharacterized protein n=1 Tax=Vigna mungo TaxID=3915 RepID=A0AAQ3RS02_VIGMU